MVEMEDYMLKSNRELGTAFRFTRAQARAALYLRIQRIFDQLPDTFNQRDVIKAIKVCPNKVMLPGILVDSFRCTQLTVGFKKP